MYGLFILPFLTTLSIHLAYGEEDFGSKFLKLKTQNEKEAFLENYTKENPYDVNALFNLALIKFEKKEEFLSYGMLRRILFLDPGFSQAYKALEKKASVSFFETVKVFVFKVFPFSFLIPLNLLLFFLCFFLFFFKKRNTPFLFIFLFLSFFFRLCFRKRNKTNKPRGYSDCRRLGGPLSSRRKSCEPFFCERRRASFFNKTKRGLVSDQNKKR